MSAEVQVELRTANQIAYLQLLAATTIPERLPDREVQTVRYLYEELARKFQPPPGWTPPDHNHDEAS